MTKQKLNTQELNELRVIIDEMTDKSIRMVELRSTYIAKGIPAGQMNRLVNAAVDSDNLNIEQELHNMISIAESRYGSGIVKLKELTESFNELVEIQVDLTSYRQTVAGFDVHPFVVNKLVEIQSQSPLDKGSGLLHELNKLANFSPVIEENTEKEELTEKSTNVISSKFIDIQNLSEGTKKLVIDIILGISLGIGGIHLLT